MPRGTRPPRAARFTAPALLARTEASDQAKTGHGCSQELISLRTSSWNPFGCPEHPFLRRGNPPTPCTCRVADRVSCGGTGHYECTNDWINEHKIIC